MSTNTASKEYSMIQINGTITFAPGTIANSPETVASIGDLVRSSRAEEGCIDYTFAQDLLEPDSLVIYERWRDAEALAIHGKSAHMAEFQKALAANPPIGRNLRMYDTDEGKAL